MLYYALLEMQNELLENRLEVILIPQVNPPNVGACIRVAARSNCSWYQKMCGDFPSKRRYPYRKFKTAVKRRHIVKVLEKMIAGRDVKSKYADWITSYAERLDAEYSAQQKNNN